MTEPSTPEHPGGGQPSSLVSDIERAIGALNSEIDAYTEEMLQRAKRPQVLLHFTDCAGLVGILQSRAL